MLLDGFGRSLGVMCGKNPLHVVSVERPGVSTLEYNWTKYESEVRPSLKDSQECCFDAYHICPADGSILLPMYGFECFDSDGVFKQILSWRMYVVPAQKMKRKDFSANPPMIALSGSVLLVD